MFRKSCRQIINGVLVSACLCSGIGSVNAGGFTRGCAARDLQVMMMIEQREASNSISAAGASDAMVAMMNARIVCHEGKVVEALSIYDGLIQSIAAGAFLSDEVSFPGQ